MGTCCSYCHPREAKGESDTALLTAASENAERYEDRAGTILARVVNVYDGDTFTALIVNEGNVYRRRCRCIGYDSPEMRGKQANKDLAVKARDYLHTIIPPGVFKLTYKGMDKYGRLLVTFDVNGETLKDHMIRAGHGYAYDGGTKQNALSLA